MKRYCTGRIDINYTGRRLTKEQRIKLEELIDLGEVEAAIENAVDDLLYTAMKQAKIKTDRFWSVAGF